jgi:hypothetical protein
MSAPAKPQAVPPFVWALASLVLHVLLVASLVGQRPDRAAAAETKVWMTAASAPEPPATPDRPEAPPKAPEKPARAARKSAPRRVAQKAPAETEPPPQTTSAAEPGAGPAAGEGTLAVASEAPGPGAGGTGRGKGVGQPGSGEAGGEPERKQGPPQLSLWIDVQAFEQLALVRPGLALVTAVPGLRDMLRGSGLRPFVDLRQLRVSLSGVTAERLALAGVHDGGEKALLDTAGRIAAMRSQKPIWRGDDELRASSWVDGTGVDRGLAVHGGSFVIAARGAMPGLLGAQQPAKQLVGLSSMRERVALALTIEDAGRYLPGLQACALQALKLSVATNGDSGRLNLTAYYRAASSAKAAHACLRGPGAGAAQLSGLVDWLGRAESAQGRDSTHLEIGVTSAEIEQLLNALAWALRSA